MLRNCCLRPRLRHACHDSLHMFTYITPMSTKQLHKQQYREKVLWHNPHRHAPKSTIAYTRMLLINAFITRKQSLAPNTPKQKYETNGFRVD